MKRTELTEKTVTELKALAKKKKVSLPAGGKKAKMIDALMALAKAVKPATKRAAVPAKKAAVKKAAIKKAVAKPVKAKKATKTTASPGKVSVAKTAWKKPATRRKVQEAATPVREWKLPPTVEEPLMAQERVSETKYYTGPALQALVASHGELPRGYGEDKVAILSRDPFVAYAYWEVSSSRIEREKAWLGWDSKLCVRIYDITGVQFDGRNAIGFFDQEVFDRIGNWYFDFGRPSHSFCVDLGLITPQGRFLTLARSNYITMPRDGVSDVVDEEWMLVDDEFWKLYGYPAGARRGVSSPEMQEMLKRRRELEITSPGLFSRDSAKRK